MFPAVLCGQDAGRITPLITEDFRRNCLSLVRFWEQLRLLIPLDLAITLGYRPDASGNSAEMDLCQSSIDFLINAFGQLKQSQ